MRKWFVLSKRTVLSKRNVTQSFGADNSIIIPMSVVDEVQKVCSTQYDERAKIAQEFLKYIGKFDTKKLVKEGVKQENGSILKIVLDSDCDYVDMGKMSSKIDVKNTEQLQIKVLKTCLYIKQTIPKTEKVVLVSKNTALRMKAELLDIEAKTFRDEMLPEISEQYTGRTEVTISDAAINKFFDMGEISIKEVTPLDETQEFYPNMFILMKSDTQSALGRVNGEKIVSLVHEKYNPYRVIPKNYGQKFMIEALMMDEKIAPLVIIKGPAGTAKTFLSLAAGLEHTEKDRFKNKILISRSPTETGEKIGYLPGDEIDKIGPYLRGIMDNLVSLTSRDTKDENQSQKNKKQKSGTYFFEKNIIKAEAVGFIRGRSICDTYIIIDEAQNLTPTEIKTIITRVGTGTKLVLIGDPAQIDRPELSETDNGLSYASERLKGEETCWQITMTDDESVRSELAKRASMLL